MMKRANVRIRGNVQMAGFRTFIKNIADSLNVKGFTENVEDGRVRVEEVNVAYEEYKGEFIGFERRGADVPGEESEMVALMRSFDKKGEVMIGILGSMNETLGSMNGTLKSVKEDTSQMLEKQDQMLEKQDETIGAIKGVSEKIDRSKEEIVTEISSLREDLRSYMENKFTRIEHEIEAIKAKIGMV